MLSGKGFKDVYNLSGGIKAWDGHVAIGKEEMGLEMFSGREEPEKTLVVAYSLETGLRDFYLSMIPKVVNKEVKDLFQHLSEIEIKHKDRVFSEYLKITDGSISREQFEESLLKEVVEGGMTTDEYINLFNPDIESTGDIIGLAMSIEAQALDLYLRAAGRIENPDSKKALFRIADEEQTHLALLGEQIN